MMLSLAVSMPECHRQTQNRTAGAHSYIALSQHRAVNINNLAPRRLSHATWAAWALTIH